MVATIVVEEYLEDKDNPFDGINDYKFLCFNGNAKYIVLDVDRKVNYKETSMIPTGANRCDYKMNITEHIPKPEGLDEMLRLQTYFQRIFPLCGLIYTGLMVKLIWEHFLSLTGYVNLSR